MSESYRSDRPSSSRAVMLSAAVLVSESLFLPLVRDYGGRIALLHATTGPDRASLGQSRTLASAISDHSAVLAGGSPIQFSVTASHHGFTVRYSLLVCLRPIGFRIAPDTPHYWLSHLNGVVCRSRTFTCKVLHCRTPRGQANACLRRDRGEAEAQDGDAGARTAVRSEPTLTRPTECVG